MCPSPDDEASVADTPGGEGAIFTIPPALGPRDAAALAARLGDWLAARRPGAVLDLGPGRATPTPTALQLLVAATRGEAHDAASLGPRAEAALATLGTLLPHPATRG